MIGIVIFCPLFRLYVCESLQQQGVPQDIIFGHIYHNTLNHLDAFIMGGAITVFGLHRFKQQFFVFLFLISCFLFLILGVFVYNSSPQEHSFFYNLGYGTDDAKAYQYIWRYSLLNLLFASLTAILISGGAKHFSLIVQKIFSIRFLTGTGKISYGIYVLHVPVLIFLHARAEQFENSLPLWIWVIINSVVVYVAAFLSYHLYEKRFLLLKRKFR